MAKDWKRSDITQEMVLSAAEAWDQRTSPLLYPDMHMPTFDYLVHTTGAPKKVVWAALEREDDLGYLECGINLRGAWLTDEGKVRLREIRELVEVPNR